MSGHLLVVAPGLHSTIQDLGRFGYQAYGVPVAGALDPVGLRLANAVAGNDEGVGGLEFLYSGPTLEVAAAAVRIAASAAEIEVLSDPPRRIPPWQSVRLGRGARFRLGAPRGSVCGYLAVEGGFAIAPVLGSQSTYVRSRIGGLDGRPLRAGDRLALELDSPGERGPGGGEVCLADPPDLTPPARLRVVLGPQDDSFTQGALDAFLDRSFTVSQEADRMGLRLSGPRLDHGRGFDIVSDGIVTGAIQVPGSGQPIVLLADHQTTGGYPKIATVISADLPAAGRLKPGDDIGFAAVSVAEAQKARQALEADLGRRIRDLVPAQTPAALNRAALYGGNLISGVVDGADS